MARLYTQTNERVTIGGPSEGAERNQVPFSWFTFTAKIHPHFKRYCRSPAMVPCDSPLA